MDPLLGINAYTPPPLVGFGTSGAITPSYGLLASELSLATLGMSGNTSTVVGISGLGQLLAAAATFQDKLQALQPGTATSGGGQNFGTDFASLAAETQSLVDAINGLQNSVANISGASSQLGGSVAGAAGLTQSLNAQAQASYSNGNSTLTDLSQLGIKFQPSQIPGAGGKLSIDLGKLQSAFNTDATGAFALLAKAANAFSAVAGDFISQSGSQYAFLSVLLQAASGATSFSNTLLPQTLTNNSDFFNLLSNGQLAGSANMPQLFHAINEYSMVSALFG